MMISMLQRHAVQVLVAAGHGATQIAQQVGVSERTVRRIAREREITDLASASRASPQAVGRPSKTASFKDEVTAMLEAEPQIKTVEVLHRLRGRGCRGAKSAVYSLVGSLRASQPTFVMRFEAVPGEFSQHDFGEVWVSFVNGDKRKVRFLASRLKYSRWVQVTMVANQQVEALVRTLVGHFELMGGVPLLAVFDRPTTIALKWDKAGRVTQWNATFAQAMFDLGVGVELCWPGRGQEKGTVENLVGWVKGSFFKQRRFIDADDLASQLADWHLEANEQRPNRATGEVPAQRMAAERARLRPLKLSSESLALRYATHVGPTAEVMFDGKPYSMPPAAIGLPATLYLYSSSLRIVAGRFSAEHPRLRDAGTRSILPEHRAEQVAAVSGQRGRRYLKREHLLQLGPEALDFLTELVHRRPLSWYEDVDQLHSLLQDHGDAAMRQAIQEANRQQVYGAEYVRAFLTRSVTSHAGNEVVL